MSRVDPIARERAWEDERKKSDKRSTAQERARQHASARSSTAAPTTARAAASSQGLGFTATNRWPAPRPLMTAPTAVKVRGRSKFFDALAVRAPFIPQVQSRRPSVMRPIVLYPYPMNETMLKQYQAQLGPQFQALPGRAAPTTLGDVIEKSVAGTGKPLLQQHPLRPRPARQRRRHRGEGQQEAVQRPPPQGRLEGLRRLREGRLLQQHLLRLRPARQRHRHRRQRREEADDALRRGPVHRRPRQGRDGRQRHQARRRHGVDDVPPLRSAG